MLLLFSFLFANVGLTKERVKMIAIGQLLSTLTTRVIISVVSGETTVPAELLYENEDFIRELARANTMEELVDWVNENY